MRILITLPVRTIRELSQEQCLMLDNLEAELIEDGIFVDFSFPDEKGYGRALRNDWMKERFEAKYCSCHYFGTTWDCDNCDCWTGKMTVCGRIIWYDAYVHLDSDFAMPLKYVKEMIDAIEWFDVVIGSRRMKESVVRRTVLRGAISDVFQHICRFVFRTDVLEHFCGFRAFSGNFVRAVMPLCKENHWMIQPEMVIAAERLGYPVIEIPIEWTERRYKRTPIKRQFQDAKDVIPGIIRLLKRWR